MGDVSRIAITGAAGLVGRHLVAAARAEGVAVTAILRGVVPQGWEDDPQIRVLRCDLADPAAGDALDAGLSGAQAVIHAAAHLGDDPARHESDTRTATAQLLAAMARARAHRLVLISSVAVYDPARAGTGPITEDSPLIRQDRARDAYAAAKLDQETQCRAAATADGYGLWLLRAGIVWGPGHLVHAHLGIGLGPFLLRIGRRGAPPIIHVERLAELVLKATQLDPGGVEAVNLVDPDQPDRDRYIAALRDTGWPRRVIPVSYGACHALARLCTPLGTLRPGLLRADVLRQRMGPQRYPDTLLQRRFGPIQHERFETLMHAAQARMP